MQKKQYGLLKIGVLSALMMLVIMLPSMLQNHGIYVIRGDYIDQYLPRLIRAREILTSGGASWDWFNFLGSSFHKVNILFSTNVVCLLFPSRLIPYAATYMHLVRIALISMAAYAYLRYMVKEEKNAFLGALLYTFSSYTFVNLEFMQFLEALWTFPLLLLSVEMMFRDEKYRYQLILMVFLSCAISFYFFVFSSLLFGVYFLSRFFLAEEWKPKRNAKYFGLAVIEYLIGFFCAFLIFAPFLYQLFHSSGSADKIGNTEKFWIEYFVDRNVVSRVFSFFLPGASNRFSSFGVSNWTSRATYLPVFGIALVVAGFLKKGMPKWLKILSVSGAVCVLIPLVCFLFNMFSSTDYTRHGYGTILFFVLATVWYLENYDEKIAKKSLWFVVRGLLFLLAIYYLANSLVGRYPVLFHALHSRKGEESVEQAFRVYVLIAAAAMYLCLFGFVYCKGVRKHVLPIIVVVILLYGCSYTMMNLRSDFLLDYYPESSIDVKTQVERYFVDKPKMEDGSNFRIDSSKQLRNYAYTVKKPSISVFESVRSRYSDELCEYLNYHDGGVCVFPQDNDNETRTLLGVKYYYDIYPEDGIPVPKGFSYLRTDCNVDIYQNDRFMGMGFSYDTYLTRTELNKIAENKENCAEILLNTLVVEDEDVAFVKDTLKPYQEGHLCQERVLFDEFHMSSDGFSAEVDLQEPTMMLVSAPYEDKGWIAECNGEKLDFIKGNTGLIAFRLDAGVNKIEFHYSFPGERMSRYVTCMGWIALLVYVMMQEKKRMD